jgi:hypothetical protein
LPAQVESSQKINALMDSITMHAAGGKAIVFVNTKVCACAQTRGDAMAGAESVQDAFYTRR